MELRSSKTKLFCEISFKNEASNLQNKAFLRDFLQTWSFEALKRSFSARLHSKMKLRNSKTKLFCDASFKNGASNLQNEAYFLRDFLQTWSFEALKRSFSARLPSKMKLRNSKTKLFCDASFKNGASRALKRSLFSARFPSKMKLRSSKTKLFCETSFKNGTLEALKQSFSARLPSKMKLRNSTTKLLCEISFKNEASKL